MAKRYISDAGWRPPDETHYFMAPTAQWGRMDLTLDENPFSVTLSTLVNVRVTSGVWNKPKSRLEC